MRLAKNVIDVGLSTNHLEPMLRFWQQGKRDCKSGGQSLPVRVRCGSKIDLKPDTR
jgi:hypothetical protein